MQLVEVLLSEDPVIRRQSVAKPVGTYPNKTWHGIGWQLSTTITPSNCGISRCKMGEV
jgi:hypothetical protein